ncbi:MAG: hypothetical protein Q8O54_06730 [Brevundimonas sp.]|nr:hypothetical protein [Brevundimonas sp.]
MSKPGGEVHPLDQEHYAFLNSQMRFRTEQIQGKFDLFIKIFSAVVAGSVWLSYQGDLTSEARDKFALVSLVLVWWIALLNSAMILSHDAAWIGYRRAVVEHGPRYPDGSPKVPPVNLAIYMRVEFMMVAGMLAAALAFSVFNPFLLTLRTPDTERPPAASTRLDSRGTATDTPAP